MSFRSGPASDDVPRSQFTFLSFKILRGVSELLLYRWRGNSERCSILAPESCFTVVRSLHHRCYLIVSTRKDDPNTSSTISSCSTFQNKTLNDMTYI